MKDVYVHIIFFKHTLTGMDTSTGHTLATGGKTDEILCQLSEEFLFVFGLAKANGACHNSRTAFCEFIFMSAQSNC